MRASNHLVFNKYLGLLSVAVIKQHDKKKLKEEEVNFSLQLKSIMKKSPSRNLDGRTEGILVTGLFFMAFSADFLRLLNRLPRGGTTHKERNLPQQSLIKKNTPIDLPASQSDIDICSVEVYLTVCFKSTNSQDKHEACCHCSWRHLRQDPDRNAHVRPLPGFLTML